MFSPEFTGQRAQTISHDHAHHFECSDCHYQTLVACVPLSTKHQSLVTKFSIQSPDSFLSPSSSSGCYKVLRWSQRAHCFFYDRHRRHIRAPKGHSAFWKRPSENLHLTCILLIGTLAIFLSSCVYHKCSGCPCDDYAMW